MGEVAEARGTAVDATAVEARDFDAFYARERDRLVRAVAFAISDGGGAADVVDEAMARAFQRWSAVGAYRDPSGWVYRVAVNLARSRWRRARRLVFGGGDRADQAVTPPGLPDEALWRAVAGLPDGQRDAVVLRFVLDWDFARLAGALDIEPSSARARVSRAVATLRDELEVSS